MFAKTGTSSNANILTNDSSNVHNNSNVHKPDNDSRNATMTPAMTTTWGLIQ